MSSALKGGLALGGVGAAAGGGYLIHSSLPKEEPKTSLASKLEEDKFTPLNLDTSKTENQNSPWKKILSSYKSLTASKTEFKIGNLSLKSDDNKGINQLKDACSDLLKTLEDSSNFASNYKLASRWCVEPISISSLLSKRGTPHLNTTESEDTEAWTALAKKYEEHKKTNKELMDGVSWTEVSNTDYTANINQIKSACNTRKDKSSHDDEAFEKHLREVQTWCTAIK
ncbi:hypothetical protein MHF_1412 [Mycoplasma haemofelis Ohio2]|uniref:Uncharacterized protein n=1 Tax=Mycoplasma haemofelis (strain Ohio2) TaxID=859194 RepID=F6FGK8_MYCHI|nr:hypothetical protein MHF_1412 [Mycoplasma haemofelis Ohio2]